MAQQREVKKWIRGQMTSDGAGVTLRRLIASHEIDMLDPFLLFDAFG
ncbi:MAG TPA: quercetin 2,3-dioxygenase, partial [Methylophaga sp.]|nr:quercetin 2,3-dioxygenase [Methylophaga sp.]